MEGSTTWQNTGRPCGAADEDVGGRLEGAPASRESDIGILRSAASPVRIVVNEDCELSGMNVVEHRAEHPVR